MEAMTGAERMLRDAMAGALGLGDLGPVRVHGHAGLDSAYPVSDLAAASVATFALAAARLRERQGVGAVSSIVDRGLTDAWFSAALRPIGWTTPPAWDPIAGDYRALAADGDVGWIRLHTNAPHHRAAALRVLGVAADRDAVAAEVAGWSADALEDAVVAEGGCAARMRTPDEWAAHPQGLAVAGEPLVAIDVEHTDAAGAAGEGSSRWRPDRARPLAGIRVLDLTRVLAGPVATRALALLGADVLRIDPPGWDEPAIVPDVTLGKRTARLDADDPIDRERLAALLAEADVLVHGYRPGALDRLGLGAAERAAMRPGLIDVSLDAYGHTGPWAGRRGFDSLVQMSTGIAAWGLVHGIAEAATPLPVQALDHGTGWLMAAAVVRGLERRVAGDLGVGGFRARLSLARTAAALEAARGRRLDALAGGGAELPDGDLVATPWGAASVLPAPFAVGGVRPRFATGPRELGSDPARWS